VRDGRIDVDLEDMYPGCKCDAELAEVGTNGLCQIDFLVERNQRLEVKSSFLMYVPGFRQGGFSKSLPTHN
jgi:hypothetical protein